MQGTEDSATIEHAAADEASQTSDATLRDFRDLPLDLQRRIVMMSCWLPEHSDPSTEHSHLTQIDVFNAKSMALVCRAAYGVVVKVLYEHIRITRPSILRMLVDTITRRPVLGRLIKSLHIGPEDVLPADWFPVGENKALCVQLCGREDRVSAPSWSRAPSFDYIAIESGRAARGRPSVQRALTAAVQAACEALDVDLLRLSCSRDGSHIEPCVLYGPIPHSVSCQEYVQCHGTVRLRLTPFLSAGMVLSSL